MQAPKCPFCDAIMRERNGKRGKFWGCSRFPNCKGTRDMQIVYPEPKDIRLVKGSPEQEAIWDWLQNGTENGLIEARAGVGKSFTIVNSIARLRGIKIGVFSFNNHIIKEMNNKLQQEGISWARGYTYNSFGSRAIRNHLQLRNAELFSDKVPTLLMELVPDDDSGESFIIRNAAEKLVRFCKYYMEDGKDEEVLMELVERFNIDLTGGMADDQEVYDNRIERIFRVVPRTLELCLSRQSTYDFDDQVWWVVKMGLPVERFDLIMVDEAQDTNKMQQRLIEMACP